MPTKILFRVPGDSARAFEVESMWGEPVSNGYRLDNIPFYAKEIALEDIVSAEPDADGALWFSQLVEESGHSTVQIWFEEGVDVQSYRDQLLALGCPSELSDLPRLIAVDVPPSVSYAAIRGFLDREHHAGKLDYQEACIARGHSVD